MRPAGLARAVVCVILAGCGGGRGSPDAGSSSDLDRRRAAVATPDHDEIYNACIGELADGLGRRPMLAQSSTWRPGDDALYSQAAGSPAEGAGQQPATRPRHRAIARL